LAAGVMLGGFWPQAPLHGVATDRIETFAVATGPVDEDGEAIYFLDFLSGELRAAVIGRQVGKFTTFFERNIFADLGVDATMKPRFLMVTGMTNMTNIPRRGVGAANFGFSKSILYVTEVTGGKVAAYSLPWSPAMYQPTAAGMHPIGLLDVAKIRGGAGLQPPGPASTPSRTP
jgi:hypothetical protein